MQESPEFIGKRGRIKKFEVEQSRGSIYCYEASGRSIALAVLKLLAALP